MKIKQLAVLGFSSILGLAPVQAQQDLPPEIIQWADSVYVNATIITLDDWEMNPDPGTITQAMAVRDEIIIALGSNEEIMGLAGPNTKVVDLQGKTVVPGFVESHVHPMGGSEANAREIFKLRSTPEGYVMRMDVEGTTDETMAKVAIAMDLLLSLRTPTPEEWINLVLIHNPEVGFSSAAEVTSLMGAPRLADVQITRQDISEIVPNYPFLLSSSTSIMNAPTRNTWYHVTVDPDGAPITEVVVELP